MFSIVGILIVFGAVLAGFMMEKGPLLVLMQPSELVIIGGAAIGTMLAANPMHVLKKIFSGLTQIIAGSKFSTGRYLDTLKMMFVLFNKARKEGLVSIESDVEDPAKSPVFSKYPAFLSNHHIRDFVCDTMRMAITGGASTFDVDQMMELDMDVHHAGAAMPASALTTVADALPGLGTLVGTFLGILLCYGMVGPLAANLSKLIDDEHAYYHVLRVVMLSFIKGMSPILAIEMARRAIPEHVRPSFHEVEKTCRGKDESNVPIAA
jgi:chemotaxis protein MotA